MTASQPFTSVLIGSNLKMFKDCLVWKKNIASNFLNANRAHLKRHEDVCIFYSKQPIYNKQYGEGEAYTNKRSGRDDSGDCYGKVNKRTDTKNEGKRNPISVLEFNRETGKHPTQKPVALMEYLIKTYTNEGETVLDFTMGSGTTGVAAKKLNRSFIGIELSSEYFEIAKSRIKDT
jgi:DNA modification methylase